jgi:hypothetical protein
MKKYKFTKEAIKLLKNAEINYIDGKPVSFNEPIIMDGCEKGEESLILTVFSNSLENKKYFKEIK